MTLLFILGYVVVGVVVGGLMFSFDFEEEAIYAMFFWPFALLLAIGWGLSWLVKKLGGVK